MAIQRHRKHDHLVIAHCSLDDPQGMMGALSKTQGDQVTPACSISLSCELLPRWETWISSSMSFLRVFIAVQHRTVKRHPMGLTHGDSLWSNFPCTQDVIQGFVSPMSTSCQSFQCCAFALIEFCSAPCQQESLLMCDSVFAAALFHLTQQRIFQMVAR